MDTVFTARGCLLIERIEMTKYKTIEDFKDQIPEGATHYTNENSRYSFAFYKFDGGFVYIMLAYTCNTWMRTKYVKLDEIENLIALKPVKQPKFKYVKVDKFSFDLKKELESGELYCKTVCEKFLTIEEVDSLVDEFANNNVYRRVELREEEELIDFFTEFEKEFIKLSDKCLKTALDRFRNFKLD